MESNKAFVFKVSPSANRRSVKSVKKTILRCPMEENLNSIYLEEPSLHFTTVFTGLILDSLLIATSSFLIPSSSRLLPLVPIGAGKGPPMIYIWDVLSYIAEGFVNSWLTISTVCFTP